MTEQNAKEGLAIRHYNGKWKHAQDLGKDRRHYTGEYANYDYWSRVRVLYLELGGLFIAQLKPMERLEYSASQETAHND